MESIGIVLNIDRDKTAEFEQAFRENELPTWQDFHARGRMLVATLNRMDITTKPVQGAVQYLLLVVMADERGHHEHDNDPRFKAWNEKADAYQVAEPLVFGGGTVVSQGL
jgi:hypothetical protein